MAGAIPGGTPRLPIDPNFATPGILDRPIRPAMPGILPGVIAPIQLPALGANSQKDYMQNVMATLMQTSMELQMNYARFLGGGMFNT